MKNTFIMCLIILLFSCKKDESNTFNDISPINGKIENWNLGSDKKIVFWAHENCGFANIDNNGNFNISNLSVPNTLVSIDLSELGSLFEVSNPNIKTATAILKVYQPNDLENEIGHVHAGNRDISTSSYIDGDYKIYYIYVSGDILISGSKDITMFGISGTINSNLHLKKGWNKYVYKIVSADSKSSKVDCVTESEPPNVKWFYERNY